MLENYVKILRGEKEPAYQMAKKIPVSFDSKDDLEKLWNIHEKTIKNLNPKNEIQKPNLLDLKIEISRRILKSCEFCERKCKIDRNYQIGFCKIGVKPRIASMFSHWGEEAVLIPSGTIFFSGCNFHCVYCQNWDISQRIGGEELSPKEVVNWVENSGCINVNWVGGEPTPNLHYILECLKLMKGNLPSVWNSNMYISEKAMKLLAGTQDIFLTDFKYGNDKCASRLSKVENYLEIVKRNHLLASKQAELIIRHLVLPNHIECCTRPILEWIKENIPNSVVNVMDQYRPVYKAKNYPEINRTLKLDEYRKSEEFAKELNLKMM
jgi:putative pyruvate formate lyase activating enzyme